MPFVDIPTADDAVSVGGPIWAAAPLLKGQTHFEPRKDTKNIMITGGAGFIASWVVRHLALTYTHDYNIISFDKLDYCATLNNTAQLDKLPNFSFYQGDITNPTEVMDCLTKHNIDTVMHFAAQSHVDLSFGNSYEFTATNVYGTHVLLECVRGYGKLKKFIHVSTDEVYGEVKDDDDDLIEESLLAPTNPYAASKAAAEMMVHAYMKSFKIPVIIVRSNNVYGPHQYPEKVIPKFTLMLQRGQKLTLHGNGANTRRYLYGADAADAFDTILHKGQEGHVYNVGSYDEISNLQLCSMLLKHFGVDAEGDKVFEHITHVQDRPFNDHRYAVDGSRLRALGWDQKTSFEDGLRMTVNWYRDQDRGSKWWGNIDSRLQAFPEPPTPPVSDTSSENVFNVCA
ncbi:NAD(P)-binding protein [Myriangium duriaei CBS 260.36]|uniref:NAD(P)-binding protein n=1 Tax=Myriangium duriaei CBS 260.36 TaxID=1168546 RepID=A0A9P4JBL6_9PEZI|nr:NAD(P)-binding protein [Myriangium duriaei CBS 260.36]